MSTFSIGGLATGLDTNSIISQLMELERSPQRVLKAKQKTYQSQADIYTRLKNALTNLKTVATGISTSSGFRGMQSTVADSSVLTVTATSTASPGNHTLEVLTLARSQRQVTTGYASDAVFSTGSFSVDDGAGSVTSISISEGSNTLQGIAAAINSSGGQVTASIINDGSATPYRLVITGKDTKNYTLDFSALTTPPLSGAPAQVPGFLGPADPSYQAGTAASFKLDGIVITKTSNAVSDVMEGVTLNLLKEGATTTFGVANDTDGATKKVNDLVAAYNNAINLINTQSAYDPTTKKAGVLSGDSTLRAIQTQLRSLLTTPVAGVSGPYSTLAQLGITSSKSDGTLSVDATKLSTALSTDFENVVDLFTHNTGTLTSVPENEYGIAQQFNLVMERLVHAYEGPTSNKNGFIETRIKGLQSSISDIDKQVAAMEDRIGRMQEAMQKRFSAMESMVSSLQTQGNAMIASLNSLTNNKM